MEEKNQHLSNKEIQIVIDALLHEMERYNTAINMCARGTDGLVYAKNEVYHVFRKVNSYLTEEVD